MKQRGVVPNGVPLAVGIAILALALLLFFTGSAAVIAIMSLFYAGVAILILTLVSLAVRAVRALESIDRTLRERSDSRSSEPLL